MLDQFLYFKINKTRNASETASQDLLVSMMSNYSKNFLKSPTKTSTVKLQAIRFTATGLHHRCFFLGIFPRDSEKLQ